MSGKKTKKSQLNDQQLNQVSGGELELHDFETEIAKRMALLTDEFNAGRITKKEYKRRKAELDNKLTNGEYIPAQF